MLALFLAFLALGVTCLSLWRRNIVFSMGAALSWLVLGILLLTSPDTLSLGTIDEAWVQVLGYLFVLMTIGCLLYYISGIGKTKITMSDAKGRSWQIWGKPPKEAVESRSNKVKRERREALSRLRRRA